MYLFLTVNLYCSGFLTRSCWNIYLFPYCDAGCAHGEKMKKHIFNVALAQKRYSHFIITLWRSYCIVDYIISLGSSRVFRSLFPKHLLSIKSIFCETLDLLANFSVLKMKKKQSSFILNELLFLQYCQHHFTTRQTFWKISVHTILFISCDNSTRIHKCVCVRGGGQKMI